MRKTMKGILLLLLMKAEAWGLYGISLFLPGPEREFYGLVAFGTLGLQVFIWCFWMENLE